MYIYLRHILWWIVAAAILNSSIDVAGDDPATGSQADTNQEQYNEIESLAELVMDETTDQSLPDQKDNDNQGLIKKTSSFDFTVEGKKTKIIFALPGSVGGKYRETPYNRHLSPGFRTIFSPPPNS